jgi:phage FluMu gp28-like protein
VNEPEFSTAKNAENSKENSLSALSAFSAVKMKISKSFVGPNPGQPQAKSVAAEGTSSASNTSKPADASATNLGAGTSSNRRSAIANPKSLLLPYQRKWVDDPARFKIGCWSRQVGKSFACAAEAVESSLLTPKTEWVILSAGERQALEFMRKVKEWAEAWRFAIADYAELRDSAEAVLKSAEVNWPNGSRVLALPANPDTARGYSANLILDEFAFHEKPDEIWRAIYPSITNPLKGAKAIRIVSTPNGSGNKFHDLWSKPNEWSKHRVTIHDAVAQGLPLDIEQLRAGLDDPDGWAQEFECEFVDSAAVLLPYELIATCESPEATVSVPPEFYTGSTRSLYCGIDFGRKKDLTVCWTAERIGDVLQTREVLELRNTDTPTQIEILRPRLRSARRVCLDYTGPGVGLGDFLAKEFGPYDPSAHKFGRVELCQFTNPLKVDVFSKLRMAFEQVKLRVPVSRVVREDLHSMQRVTTATGSVTYRAPHTEDGHADRCTALALCVRAGTTAGGAIIDPSTIRSGANANGHVHAPRRLKPIRKGIFA